MKTNNVVIFLQFVTNYENLVRYGVKLASDLKKAALLSYTYNPISVPLVTPGTISARMDYTGETVEKMHAESREKIERIIEMIQREEPGLHEIHYQLSEGFERNIIQDLTNRRDVDMILTINESGNIFTVSSSSNEIIKDSICPVFIVPSDYKYKPIERIVYATDYHSEDFATI
ncbi:MAG: universal stress protein [Bacteroidales bacterium]|nr:universal stress protein [Bacteroidales bacterium]